MKNTENNSKIDYSCLSAREYNNIVRCVNDGTPRDEVKKYYDEQKMKIFDEMTARLKEERKKTRKLLSGLLKTTGNILNPYVNNL